MHSELAGRRIFITGISRGIGFATARLFLTEGASVFGVARDEARLTGARAALASAALTPDHFDAFPLDLGRSRDTTISRPNDLKESCCRCRIRQGLSRLVQSGLLQRHNHGRPRISACRHCPLRCFKVPAQEQENRRLFCYGRFGVSMEATAGAGGITMEVHRRVRSPHLCA